MKVLEEMLSFIAVVTIIALLIGFPIMWLWNSLMPSIFGLVEITFWQSVGLFLLSSILFKPTSGGD